MIEIAGLSDHQLLQRDLFDRASVRLQGAVSGGGVRRVVITAGPGAPISVPVGGGGWQTEFNLPTGGPYQVDIAFHTASGELTASRSFREILVGDIWLLAGQSNMQGRGDMENVESPSPNVHVFGMNGRWSVAEEPLHRLLEATDPAYHRKGESPGQNGAGLGLTFAKALHAALHVPAGLVPCSLGGTSIALWDPRRKDVDSASLYGAMIRRFHAAGGKARGVLWYQGEADARDPRNAYTYEAKLLDLINALRKDTGLPNLAFYWAQVGRMLDWLYYGAIGRNPPATLDAQFTALREAQRTAAEKTLHAGAVSTIDLTLRDGIHLATPDLKRLGIRLANAVLGSEYADLHRPGGPKLRCLWNDRPKERIHVEFSGVQGGLTASGRLTGFSLWTAEGQEVRTIYRMEVSPLSRNSVILYYQGPLPAGVRLVFGWGVNPYCNLVDEADMAVTAFGPIEIQERC